MVMFFFSATQLYTVIKSSGNSIFYQFKEHIGKVEQALDKTVQQVTPLPSSLTRGY